MEKKPFATREKLEEIAKEYPTPFHLYDEKGIRDRLLFRDRADAVEGLWLYGPRHHVFLQ